MFTAISRHTNKQIQSLLSRCIIGTSPFLSISNYFKQCSCHTTVNWWMDSSTSFIISSNVFTYEMV